MSKSVTVQAVSGAIRSTAGIKVSHKYSGSGRGVRSTGVYVEKSYGTIVIGFWSGDWAKLYAEQSTNDLAKAIATLRSKGMDVIERKQSYSTFLEVVAA